MADFHFLRPLWLLLILAIPLLPFMLRFRHAGDSGWHNIIPQRLLAPLLPADARRPGPATTGVTHRLPQWLPAGLALLVLALALAGPSWRQAPTPLQQQDDSLVIVLDLSLSMLANDVQPDRLTRAKRKIRDILAAREGSLTALVVYTADGHVVSPLTDDRRTIEGMLEALDPVMMPAQGNRADLGVARAQELLAQGAPARGRILLISDEVYVRYRTAIRSQLSGTPWSLSTIVTGTTDGGPIPLAKRGFLRDSAGTIVITRANPDSLADLAAATGGSSQPLTLNDDDIRALGLGTADAGNGQQGARELAIERWQDDGYWLLWLAALLVLPLWRRGALLALLLLVSPLAPQPAMALEWEDLWLRPDQRAEDLIRQDPRAAASRLDDPQWQGTALYRSGDFEAAAEAFGRSETADALYNRGNALARSGELSQALAAYDAALAAHPGHEDATFNRALVERLLEQQQQDGGQQQSGADSEPDQQQQEGDQQGQQDGEGQRDGRRQQKPGGEGETGQQNDSSAQQSGPGEQGPTPENRPQPAESGEDGAQDSNDSQPTETPGNAPGALQPGELSQGQEQALRRIPDDPGGLLRRKFLQQFQERNTQPDKGDTPW